MKAKEKANATLSCHGCLMLVLRWRSGFKARRGKKHPSPLKEDSMTMASVQEEHLQTLELDLKALLSCFSPDI